MTTGEKQKKRSRNKAIYKILLVCINIPISTKIVESYQFVSFQETGPKKLNKKTKLIPSNFKNQGFCVKRQSVYARKYKCNLPIFFLQELFQFAWLTLINFWRQSIWETIFLAILVNWWSLWFIKTVYLLAYL